MKNELLSGALGENVLTLLCFFDDEAGLIKNSVDPGLFESNVFQNIARAACEYHDSYKTAPKEHLPDILENTIKNEDQSTLKLYDQTFKNLYDAADGLNPKFVLSQLGEFIEQQTMKIGTVNAMKLLQSGNVAEAKLELTKSLGIQYDVFDPGLFINKPEDFLRFLNPDKAKVMVRTGIPELDAYDICPTVGEMFLILALPNNGKSWFMLHLARMAMLQRLKVAHITLEMNPDNMMMRYAQSLFSMSKRGDSSQVTRLLKGENGRVSSIDFEKMVRPGLDDPRAKEILTRKHGKILANKHIVVKQFPPRTLKISGLAAYLDGLARINKFMPDVVVLDYADDMYVSSKDFRIATSALYKELRGLAVDRQFALITASQANRSAAGAKIITMDNFSEDFSKAHTADIVVSYNQTKYEKPLGLARLFTAKVRNDESSLLTLITQSYKNGQFCLDSARMDESYWDLVARGARGEEEESES